MTSVFAVDACRTPVGKIKGALAQVRPDQLTAEVQLKPRIVFTRTKVQADVKRILELYRRNGRFAATVDAKVIQLPQNRVDLVFEINEGASTGIKTINFIGSHQFSVSKLKEVISTRESRFPSSPTSSMTSSTGRGCG